MQQRWIWMVNLNDHTAIFQGHCLMAKYFKIQGHCLMAKYFKRSFKMVQSHWILKSCKIK